MHLRQLFLDHVAQTSSAPLMLEIERAEGCWLFGKNGERYLDLISGISVCNIGHSNAAVIAAVEDQVRKYMHIMVYGELIETPQVQYAQWLAAHLPLSLNSVYFTNSGSEAVEGALKLAKRVTGRTEVISFDKSYHGSTMGALSAGNTEERKNAFRPLIPDNTILRYNDFAGIAAITEKTACVLAEAVQAEAGVILPENDFLSALKQCCTEKGALFILDECQTGFGRTGSLFYLEQSQSIPDILVLGKAMGGGMPLGAFIADIGLMRALTHQPVLGHLTTFGGHPVCCAAGLAAAKELERLNLTDSVASNAKLFLELLHHPAIKAVRSAGLLIAVEFESPEINFEVNKRLVAAGILTDWFLFAPHCLRLAPPLIIGEANIRLACSKILYVLETL